MVTTNTITEENVSAMFAGLKIRKPGDVVNLGVNMTLYAQGGGGKTILVANAARELGGRTLHIDADGGTDVIEDFRDDPNYDIIDIKSYNEFIKISDALKRDVGGYKNVIVDNLSELVNMAEDWAGVTNEANANNLKNYMKMTGEILDKTRLFRDIARTTGINVFFIAWDADEKDERGIVKKELDLTPALRKEYPGIVTIIGHIEVLNDPNKRKLNFAPGPKTVSKFRRSTSSKAMEVPFQIFYGLENLPLADVIRTIKGEQSWPKSKYPTPATPN